MAVSKQNDFSIGDSNLNGMMVSINGSYKGKAEITISNYDNDLAPAVKVGSEFDCNGGLYIVKTADETPSGYPGIANDTMFYLVFDVSALSFVYTSTAPTWSDSLQGWYNGNDRYFFSMYKDSGGTLYHGKKKFKNSPWFFSVIGYLTGAEAYAIIDTYFPSPTKTSAIKRIMVTGFVDQLAFYISRVQSIPLQITIVRESNTIDITPTDTTNRTWDMVTSSDITET